ncbi:unnamed protein product [Enterobius vermicularis]|uniref:Integrin_alpha2 domain-containing protein n=1 Tax=Enterobius vermicularis TaxID=51028 RepID=A0A0N4V2B0_ENTVE|nr:unnamed protein product [Enterobius vermicularis]
MEVNIENFDVPENLFTARERSSSSDFSYIGFTLSRGKLIIDGMRSKPHVCQLAQSNKGYDAVFFLYNATSKWFDIVRTGALRDLQLCFNLTSCPAEPSEGEIYMGPIKGDVSNKVFSPANENLPSTYNNVVPLDPNGHFSQLAEY